MKYLILSFLFFVSFQSISAQDFVGSQKKQQARIKKAKADNQLSDLEYSKLMEEQQIIIDEIQVANADGVMTPKEKNAINGKLNRAEKRLIKYKKNAEVY